MKLRSFERNQRHFGSLMECPCGAVVPYSGGNHTYCSKNCSRRHLWQRDPSARAKDRAQSKISTKFGPRNPGGERQWLRKNLAQLRALRRQMRKSKGRSSAIARGAIKTGPDFADLMSALMSDLILGHITPAIGNATCNAGGKLLKIVEMQLKYGTKKGPLMLDVGK